MVAPSLEGLPLVGGHPALDLVNTVEPRLPAAGHHEHLAAPGDVLVWAQRVTLISGPEAAAVADTSAADPAAADRALLSVRQIREALATALDAILNSAGRVGPGPGLPHPALGRCRRPVATGRGPGRSPAGRGLHARPT